MKHAVTARAPGKVNLSLAVAPVGADGYHPLATVFQAVSVFDDVTVRCAARTHLTVTGMGADDVPTDCTNLAWRAVLALAQAHGIDEGVDISIRKSIPVAGGMAGGSADAAAALVAVNELWSLGLSRTQLAEVAATLGSDVPFALLGHTAIGRGRGTELTQVLTRGVYQWVFATQAQGLSTARVFSEFDAVGAGAGEVAVADALLAALRAGDPIGLGKTLRNDLQEAALGLAPHLADTLAVANEAGALGVVVSGSGPTVAALAASRAHALRMSAELSKVAAETVLAHGPVGPARLVD